MTITLKPTASETTIQNNGSDIFTIDSTGIAMASGKTIQNASGDVVTNTPAFSVYMVNSQTLTNVTVTKVNFDSEVFDTANAFDPATNRFTVPSGQDGLYSFTSTIRIGTTTSSNLAIAIMRLYKNNNQVKQLYNYYINNSVRAASLSMTNVLDLVAGDYIEVFGYTQGSITGSGISFTGGSTYNAFSGHKLIT